MNAFNITVEDFHSYFVTDSTRRDADAIWVHNECAIGQNIVFNDKIRKQMKERGWTERRVRNLTKMHPSGRSIDRQGSKDEPATVFGRPGRYVVVNNQTGEVVQVSDKKIPLWKDHVDIKWNNE